MDIQKSIPSADDLIHALGLQRQSSTSGELASGFALFGAGLLVGAGLALLFAPASGEQIRQDVGRGLNEIRDRVTGDQRTTNGSPV